MLHTLRKASMWKKEIIKLHQNCVYIYKVQRDSAAVARRAMIIITNTNKTYNNSCDLISYHRKHSLQK